MSNIVLYHGGGCNDGMCSAYLMYLFFKERKEPVEFIAVNYNEAIPDVTGKHVYIVDFSYSPDVLEEARTKALSIVMLDHHLTAAQQWGGYYNLYYFQPTDTKCHLTIKIAEDKSGAGLTYDFVLACSRIDSIHNVFDNPDDDRLFRVVNSVQDRDLWKFALKDTPVIHEALSFLPKTIEAWHHFISESSISEFNDKLAEAQAFLKLKEHLAQTYAKLFQLIKFQGYEIPVVNCPSNFASRVGEILAEQYPFALMYCLSTTKVYCSLRSNTKSEVDVSAIAKVFKGGGHFHAAGFGLIPEQLPILFKGEL